jgi:hypothetical protein
LFSSAKSTRAHRAVGVALALYIHLIFTFIFTSIFSYLGPADRARQGPPAVLTQPAAASSTTAMRSAQAVSVQLA